MRTSYEAFAERAREGGMVPVTHEVLLDGDTPVTAFAKLHQGRYGFLLESLEGGERWARYTFLATDPTEVFRYQGRECSRWSTSTGWKLQDADVAPLDHLAETMRRHPPVEVPGLPRFTGGAVGYMGYDFVGSIESFPPPPPDAGGLPDVFLRVAAPLRVLKTLFNRPRVVARVDFPRTASPAELRHLY